MSASAPETALFAFDDAALARLAERHGTPCFVYRPQFMNEEQIKFELPDRTIFLAGLFPMYDEEVPMYETKGIQEFWNTPGFDPYNPRRASIAPKG